MRLSTISTKTWTTYSDYDAGYTFLYPLGFEFEKRSKFALATTDAIDEVYLSIEDKSQKPYVVEYNNNRILPVPEDIIGPGRSEIYPNYYIAFYVTKGDPYLNLAISSKLPPKDSLQKIEDIWIWRKKGSMYIAGVERVTIVKAHEYTYTIGYTSAVGPLGTDDKYLPLYYKIISTIKFSPPAAGGSPVIAW